MRVLLLYLSSYRVTRRYASHLYAVALSPCVRLSVCHKSEFYKNGRTNRARFGTKLPFSRFKLCRKDILEPPKIGARTSLWNFVPSN